MIRYAVIEAGPGVSVHDARTFGDGFESLEEAHAFIRSAELDRVQIVADERRWLTHAEQAELNRAITAHLLQAAA